MAAKTQAPWKEVGVKKPQSDTSTCLLALPGHGDVVAMPFLEWLLDNARRFGNRPAIEGIHDTPLSHAALYEQTRDIGNALRERGIGRGDVVLLSLASRPDALAAILAVASVAVAFPVGMDEPESSIDALIDRINPKAMLFERGRQSALLHAGSRHGLLPLAVHRDASVRAGLIRLDASVSAPPMALAEATHIDDAAILFKTSGTTAEPKIVALSQASLHISALTAADWMDLNENDRSLCVMPFNHLHSLVRSSMPGLLKGGAVICAPGFDKLRILDWLHQCRPTYMTASPGIFREMLARVAANTRLPLSTSLRFLATGSDRIEEPTVQALRETFGVPVREFYGLSEASPMLAATPSGMSARRGGAIGRPVAGWTLACLDATGQPVPAGEEGDIAVKGGLINPIVHGASSGNHRVGDGWFLTGDRGRLDEGGLLYVTGRGDDRINRGGAKIAPAIVEAALLKHPGVKEILAFPIPDAILGERVGALVVPSEGAILDERQLRAHAAMLLSDYMVPDSLIMVESLPRTVSGKIRRAGIARQYGVELADARPPVASPVISPRNHHEAWLAMLIKRMLDVDDFDLHTDFNALGGDSVFALGLILAIEEHYGTLLTPSQYIEHSNVAALAELLVDSTTVTPKARLLTVQAGDGQAPLVFAHGIMGHALYAHTFARLLGDTQTVLAFHWQEPVTLADKDNLAFKTVAATYTEALLARQPDGPYRLIGHSFGAHLAFEVACQLSAQGKRVAFLGLIDESAELDQRHFAIARAQAKSERLQDRLRHLLRANVPGSYSGALTLFQTRAIPPDALADPYTGWGDLTLGTVERHFVPGDHVTVMSAAMAKQWSGLLRRCLDKSASAPMTMPVSPTPSALPYSRSITTLARVASKQGNLSEEIMHYRHAISLDGTQPYWVYRNLAEALSEAGEEAASLESLRIAIRHEKNPIMGYVLLAKALKRAGRAAEVRRCIDLAMACPREEAAAEIALGDLFMHLGQPMSAARCFEQAMAIDPEHPAPYYKLGRVRTREGRIEDAIALLRRALALRPGNSRLWRQLGDLLLRKGDRSGAEQAYARLGNVWADGDI